MINGDYFAGHEGRSARIESPTDPVWNRICTQDLSEIRSELNVTRRQLDEVSNAVQIAQQERSNFCHVDETTANECGKHNKKPSLKTRKSLSYFEKTQNVLSTFNSIRK